MENKKDIPFATILICIVLVGLYAANEFNPAVFNALKGTTSDWNSGRYISLFTYSLTHTGLWHIFLNVSMIMYVASKIELRYSRVLYVLLYASSAVVAGVFFFWLYASNGYTMSMLGASGAKCGLFGFYTAMFVYHIWVADNHDQVASEFKDARVVFALIAFEIVLSFMPGIAWAAHVGGAVAGVVVACLYVALEKW